MSTPTRQRNRGPAAAAANRAALLEAAKELFADHGYNVPLSAVARAAGVGQAVLYRHFPRRIDLAMAVFEENFTHLEALAARHAPDAFERLVDQVIEFMLESFGFVELVVGARGVLGDYDGEQRLQKLLSGPLQRARDGRRVGAHLTEEDVALGLRMIYGVAATAREDAERAAAVRRAQRIVTATWGP